MYKRSGFTLIELLVVIAIIAILAAILFPVFVNVKSKGAATSCLNNCKQMGIALTNYMTDNNDTHPPYDRYKLVWQKIQPFIKSKKVVNCADARSPLAANKNGGYGDAHHAWVDSYYDSDKPTAQLIMYVGSYCTNGYLYLRGGDGSGLKMSQIPSPSKTMAFSDGLWVDCWCSNHDNPNVGPSGGVWRINIDRHVGGINMAFMGGNVAWIKINQLAMPNAEPKNRRIIYNPLTGD